MTSTDGVTVEQRGLGQQPPPLPLCSATRPKESDECYLNPNDRSLSICCIARPPHLSNKRSESLKRKRPTASPLQPTQETPRAGYPGFTPNTHTVWRCRITEGSKASVGGVCVRENDCLSDGWKSMQNEMIKAKFL